MKEDKLPNTATQLRVVPAPPSQIESLFQEHYDQIFRTAYRVTGNANDAEDVLQTIFLRLARRSGEFQLEPNPKAYLLRAAINASLDIVRTRSLNTLISIDDVTSDNFQTRPNQNPESLHSDQELRQLIQKEISNLSDKTAQMFILKYFEGLDNKEIGKILDTSHLVVGVMLHRARGQLKKVIGSRWAGVGGR